MTPMTAGEYAEALDRIGFSNRGFCRRVLNVGERSGFRWSSGDVPVPGPVAALLRLMIAQNLSADQYHDLVD